MPQLGLLASLSFGELEIVVIGAAGDMPVNAKARPSRELAYHTANTDERLRRILAG